MAGAGLRHHRRRGTQDPRERPPGGPKLLMWYDQAVTREGD